MLARERLGRVAFVDGLGPMVMPVNFVLDRHMVVFRTGGGTKLDAAVRGSRVAFEIDGIDQAALTCPGTAGSGHGRRLAGVRQLTSASVSCERRTLAG